MPLSKYIVCLLVGFVWLLFCRCSSPAVSGEGISCESCDSVGYVAERPYTLNSNFEVTSDSLLIQQLPLMDKLPIYKGEQLVVAEFMVQPADSVDSVWVKVARDQETMGWVHEKELLQQVVPVDPVSRFIYFFSNSRTVFFFVVLALFGIGYVYRAARRKKLQLVWFNDIDSVFPTLFSWLVAVSATLYGSIQHFMPHAWEQFYYNPTLNPLELPGVFSLFMFCVWGILLVGLATLDDVFKQVRVEAAFFYLLGLMSCCIFLYLFFIFAAYHYVGYLCLLVYSVWSFKRLKQTSRYRYSCGNCGAKLKEKGVCPHCGALNE